MSSENRPKHALEQEHEQTMAARRRAEMAEAEAAHWRRVVEWYASPEQWTVHVDDRGRESFNFKYGEDGGWVARTALLKWDAFYKKSLGGGGNACAPRLG